MVILDQMNNLRLSTPAPGERCACPQELVAKRAALLFDRIYKPQTLSFDDSIPSSLLFDVPNTSDHFNTTWDKFRQELFKKNAISNHMREKIPTADEVANIIFEFALRVRVESFRLAGYTITPVYNSQQRFFLDYPSGKNIVYQAAVENLPEIIEDQVSWEQVIEFRSDKDAIRKYRALRLWLEYSLSAKSVKHARDLIARGIEDYEWAIRKHGLKTATGALSSIFSWKGLISITAGMGVSAAVGGPVWSALTGAIFTVGRATVWVAERMIERQDIERAPDAAVALICDAKQLVR
jgi:hypothetical protein